MHHFGKWWYWCYCSVQIVLQLVQMVFLFTSSGGVTYVAVVTAVYWTSITGGANIAGHVQTKVALTICHLMHSTWSIRHFGDDPD